MTKGFARLTALILAVAMGIILTGTALAEVTTLGVCFLGIVPREDGTEAQVTLSGSFRVMQGGLDRGVIQAGKTTVTVSGTDPVTLVPMEETMPVGWDLSGASVTVNPAESGNLTVPIVVRRMTDQPADGTARTEEPPAEEPARETAEPSAEEPENGEPEPGQDAAASEAPRETATPRLEQTPVVTEAPTPEPTVETLSASADTAVFRVSVFLDGNHNGDRGEYEQGVADIPVYIVSEAGEIVTGGTTGTDGEVTLPGVAPGTYRIRVSLPEKYGFSRKSRETGLTQSVMDFSSEGTQDSDPITVRGGETADRGVGLLKGVTADGICWLDENGNGIMEDGERRLPGVRITMTGQKNGLSFETYSDENGYWRIFRLRAGFYDLTGYTPEGMMFTKYSRTGGVNRSIFTAEGKTKSTKTVDLNDGKDELNQHIGFIWSAQVSGIAFLDANYNGLYDEGEQPLAGVKVTAIKQMKDEEIAVTRTGEDGRYTLSGLRANTYQIRAVLPDDGSNFTLVTEDPEGNHFKAREGRRENFWKDFTLTDGEKRTVNIGAIYYGSVSGTAYLDDDFSGARNGSEKTVKGISVTLLDAQGREVDTAQTGAKGTYSFAGLTPGSYSLRMTAKKGYAFTRQGEGNVMLNLNGGEGYSEAFEVPLGTDVTGKDGGMILPAKVSGEVFADKNDNGILDTEEGGLTGTAVRLMSEAGEEFSALIGEDGRFLFDAVMPGRYYLEYRLPEGAIFAKAGGDSEIDGENGIGRSEWFSMKTAEERKAPRCGGLTLGRISGVFFHDPDGSGEREAGETPMAGMRLTLTPSRSDLETLETVSGADGSFGLSGLHPDTWTMTVTLPEDLVTARTAETELPLKAGLQTQETGLTVGMGQVWEGQMIGGVRPATLRGGVWLDENHNGLKDEGEQTPENLLLTVTDEDSGEAYRTLRTDREGLFECAGMIPGSYSVSFSLEEDTDETAEGDNTFRKEGNRMIMTGISLREGSLREDLLLGYVRYTALGGQVWIDRGQGAEPLSGAAVRLTDGDGNTLESQTTGETGAWRFTGLMPGTYRISAELPEGTVAVEPDDERLKSGLISVFAETEGRRGRTDAIDLRMGENQLSLNLGGVLPGTIGDYCWLDENENGWQDGGEYGIPHVKVELIRNGVTVAETETDQYGLYYFREVYPAEYTLKVTAPPEVKPTQKRTDIYLIVSSLLETEEETSYTEAFSVASDSTDFNIDLGYALRKRGVYPEGYGEQETMDWSRAYGEQ